MSSGCKKQNPAHLNMKNKITFVIGNPFEINYRTSSAELNLSYVEATGRQIDIRFDPHATRALCELLGQAIQANQGLLGLQCENVKKH